MEKQRLTHDYSEVSANGTENYSYHDAENYLEAVRDAYRTAKGEYKGARTDEQLEIAETASLEADLFIDDLVQVLGLVDRQDDVIGNVEDGLGLEDMKEAWRHLWIGMHMITNRLERDYPRLGITQLHDIESHKKVVIMQQLFNDFQEHNALRFGAIGNGDKRRRPRIDAYGMEQYDEDGERVYEAIEIDKEKDDHAIGRRAREIGYETTARRPSSKGVEDITFMHTAGKISPKALKVLRKAFRSDYPKPVRFYQEANSAKDIKTRLEYRGS